MLNFNTANQTFRQIMGNGLNSNIYSIKFLVQFIERSLLALKFISKRFMIKVQDLSYIRRSVHPFVLSHDSFFNPLSARHVETSKATE